MTEQGEPCHVLNQERSKAYDNVLDFLEALPERCADVVERHKTLERVIFHMNDLDAYYDSVLEMYNQEKMTREQKTYVANTMKIINKKTDSLYNYLLKYRTQYQEQKQRERTNGVSTTESGVERSSEDTKEVSVDEVKKESEQENENLSHQSGQVVENSEEKSVCRDVNSQEKLADVKNTESVFLKENDVVECESTFDETKQVNLSKEDILSTSEDKTQKKGVTFDSDLSVRAEKDYFTKGEMEKCNKKGENAILTEDSITEEKPLLSDDTIREWSKQIDKYDNLLYKHSYEYKKNDILKQVNTHIKKQDVSNEDVYDELCLLAQEMKENLLTYQEILNEDNKVLEDTANKQLLNIDTISEVSKKTKQLNQNKNISFFVSLLIIIVSVLVFMLTFIVVLFL